MNIPLSTDRLCLCKVCGHVIGQGLELCPDCRRDQTPPDYEIEESAKDAMAKHIRGLL